VRRALFLVEEGGTIRPGKSSAKFQASLKVEIIQRVPVPVMRILAAEGRGILPEHRHGSEGTVSRIIMDVDDPVSGDPRAVVINVRPNSIEHMHARGKITDVQKDVAERFLVLHERASSDGLKAIDYSKVTVDCGSMGDNQASERQIRAIHELAGVSRAIGARGYGLLVDVIVEGRSMKDITQEFSKANGCHRTNAAGYLSFRIAEALDQLSAHWDTMVGTGKATRFEIMHERTEVQTSAVEVKIMPKRTTEEALAFAEKTVAALRKMVDDKRTKEAK
jgi:hypothetical protein